MLTTITNAALVATWCFGLGATRVTYHVTADDLTPAPRLAVPFTDDPAAEPVATNYWRTGYDRGHLAPAADFTTRTNALLATYRMTNISPMLPRFNRGRWARVEAEARALVRRLGEADITTIPVYGETTNKCGTLIVPTAFLKIITTNGVAVAAWCERNTDE